MIKQEASERIEKLKKLINHYRYLYHVLDRQEISDEALDSLKKELFDLEKRFPDLVTDDSPTQRVAGKPLSKFKKIEHIAPMISLADAFSDQDIKDWEERNRKLLSEKEQKALDYFCELKFDGLAIELIYKNGLFFEGATRGNGLIGEDVTQNLRTIEAIPLSVDKKMLFKEPGSLNSKNQVSSLLVIRGEVLISKKEFAKINKEQEKSGLVLYANPRNIAAGSIRQLDPKITANRRLDFFAWDLVSDLGQRNHDEEHQILRALGFKTHLSAKHCADLSEVFKFHQEWAKKRDSLPFEIDGVVVQVNNNELFKKLGVAGKAPRGAIAFKFPLRQAQTIVENIEVQVGRTGAITPVAHLAPVLISGTVITRATLHNADEIKRLGIKVGDTVIVGRAGDVIPEVVKVLTALRTGREKTFKMPKNCPVCGSVLQKPQDEVILRCVNKKCPARQRRYFYHFVSRGAFNIEGLGPKIIDQLLDNDLISDPADLFELKEGDLVPIERFAEKSASNLVNSIQSKKKISLPRFIFALGINNVGEETAVLLAQELKIKNEKPFGRLRPSALRLRLEEVVSKAEPLKIKEFLNVFKGFSIERLEKVKDIGPVVAKSIYDWFREQANIRFLEKLGDAGITIENEKLKMKNEKLLGKTFVLTGTLGFLERNEAKEKIRALGGEVSESVSKNTDFVVVGENPGSKYDKAKKLGVKTIDEKEFLKLLT